MYKEHLFSKDTGKKIQKLIRILFGLTGKKTEMVERVNREDKTRRNGSFLRGHSIIPRSLERFFP